MERSIQKNGLINLLTLLAVGVAGLAVARYANSLAGQVSIKKVQMQGAAPGTHPPGWAPIRMGSRCEAYLARTSQRRGSAGAPTGGGSP